MKNVYYFSMLLLLTVSCQPQNADVDDLPDSQFKTETEGNGDYFTESLSIESDELTFVINYTGCRKAESRVFSDDWFKESHPVQLGISLQLSDAGDCEKLIRDTVKFSLTGIRERYQQQYRKQSGTVMLDLEGHTELLPYHF